MKLLTRMTIFLPVLILVIDLQSTYGQLTCVSKFDTNKKMVGACLAIESCVGAAINGDCADSKHTCCVTESGTAPKEVAHNIITKAIFLKISGNTARNNAIYRYFTESLGLAGITTEYQIAAYLSQLLHETDYFRSIESLIMETDNNTALGNVQTGDGTTFRGRGGILLRGRKFYNASQNANSKIHLF